MLSIFDTLLLIFIRYSIVSSTLCLAESLWSTPSCNTPSALRIPSTGEGFILPSLSHSFTEQSELDVRRSYA